MLSGGERIHEFHTSVFEIGDVTSHHRQSMTVGGGGELAVGSGQSDAAFIAAGDHLAPDVSDAGVEAEDAALHAIAETCEP